MANILDECRKFLSKDREDFQNHDFRHAQYLVEILPELKSGDVCFIHYILHSNMYPIER